MSDNIKDKCNDRRVYMREYYQKNKEKILSKCKDKRDNRELTERELKAAMDRVDIMMSELSKGLVDINVNDPDCIEKLVAMELMLDLKIFLLS